MADEADEAQHRDEIMRESALDCARQRAALRLTRGTRDCTDCGDPIPKERREALPSATRCIHCQKIFERGR